MADYGKKKNDELQTLCKERGLPATGKKADLVKRLEDHDATQSSTAPAAGAEDEIDWDDEPASAKGAAAKSEAVAPQANTAEAMEPAAAETTADAPAAETAPAAEEKPEPVDFSSGIKDLTFEEDMQKKIARAEKWGTGNVEELKAELEQLKKRAEKFGTDIKEAPTGLNSALPEKRERKRGREGDHDEGNRKRRGGRGGGGGGRGDRREGGGEKKATNGASAGSWMNEKDRAAAEARKAKWNAT